MTEDYRTRFSAVLAADPYLEALSGGATPLDTEFHEFPDTSQIDGLKWFVRQDSFLHIVWQKSAGIVA